MNIYQFIFKFMNMNIHQFILSLSYVFESSSQWYCESVGLHWEQYLNHAWYSTQELKLEATISQHKSEAFLIQTICLVLLVK